MIQLSELQGCDPIVYNAIQSKLASKSLDPVVTVQLRQYAPAWISHTASNTQNFAYSDFFTHEDSNHIRLIHGGYCNTGASTFTEATLASELDTLRNWSTTTYSFSGISNILAYSVGPDDSGVTMRTMVAYNGGASLYSKGNDAGLNYSNVLHTIKHTAVVYGAAAHVCGLTANGNWRLGYAYNPGSPTVVWSDIYWPYQVRSFDALRVGNYDVIAMVTDLPPLTDVSITGSKTQITDQRVQGIVVFRFDNTTRTWSDHSVVDSCDDQSVSAFANVKLSDSGLGIYAMTYAKRVGDVVGVAISRTNDGLQWENPLFVTRPLAKVKDVP